MGIVALLVINRPASANSGSSSAATLSQVASFVVTLSPPVADSAWRLLKDGQQSPQVSKHLCNCCHFISGLQKALGKLQNTSA